MRLLYTGRIPSEVGFKRLLLLATEVGFCDKPSLAFGKYFSPGVKSPVLKAEGTSDVVRFSNHAPPDLLGGAPATDPYKVWLRKDLDSKPFRRVFLEGIKNDAWFWPTLLKPDGIYFTSLGSASGADIAHVLSSDPALYDVFVDHEREPDAMFDIATPQGRIDTLHVLMQDCSTRLTAIWIVADRMGLNPVTENQTVQRLMAIRGTYENTRDEPQDARGTFAIEVSRSVIPDEVLQQLTIRDILKYRDETRESYHRCMIEIARMAASITSGDSESQAKSIRRIIESEVNPHMQRYADDLVQVRDEMFAKLVRNAFSPAVPVMSIAAMTVSQGVLAGLGGALTGMACGVIPELIDSLIAQRSTKRRHALSYLIDIK